MFKLNLFAITITALIPSLTYAAPPNDIKKETSSILNESEQAKSAGILEDSDLNLLIRNVYFNRDFRNSSHNGHGSYKAQSYQEEWGQGFILNYQSGFTQGTVGFGVDALGMYGFKLDTGRGRTGIGLTPTDRHGRAEDNYSKAVGAVKARISSTTLKYGEQIVDTPVFSTDDARLLPETAEGFLLTSNEIKNLTINAGHFTSLRAMGQSYRDSRPNDWGLYNSKGTGLKRADFIGGSYQFTDNLSAALYYSNVKDFWKKKYLGIDYAYPIDDKQAVNLSFNYYNTKSQGPVKYLSRGIGNGHKIDSNAWSLQGSYTYDAHKFTLAYQAVTGKGMGNPYGIDGGGSMYLANSVQYSDFNNAGERSWQARYDLDMTNYGVPGLNLMARYVSGSNISEYLRASDKSGGKVSERETNFEAKYVVQTGPAKNLNFRVRYSIYRSSGFSNDVNEVRLITEYPWDILGTFRK